MSEPFDVKRCLLFATGTLLNKPRWPHVERHEPKGALVYRAVIPLELSPPQNRTRHTPGWKLGKIKSACMALMRAQLELKPTCPLSGRPQVLAMRFSSRETDAYADFAKLPIDCLVKLGFLVDDRPSCVEVRQWSEYAPPKSGFVYLELYTGAEVKT